jgi:DUF2971 family protein
LCCSRKWHNPLLWSHYADKHRGVCLGFDVPKGFVAEVYYDDGRLPDIVPQLLQDGPNAEALWTRLLATKFRDWTYEDEVRIHADLKDADVETGHYFKDFSTDLVLAEVVLGPRFSGSRDAVVASARSISPDVSLIPLVQPAPGRIRSSGKPVSSVPNRSWAPAVRIGDPHNGP